MKLTHGCAGTPLLSLKRSYDDLINSLRVARSLIFAALRSLRRLNANFLLLVCCLNILTRVSAVGIPIENSFFKLWVATPSSDFKVAAPHDDIVYAEQNQAGTKPLLN